MYVSRVGRMMPPAPSPIPLLIQVLVKVIMAYSKGYHHLEALRSSFTALVVSH